MFTKEREIESFLLEYTRSRVVVGSTVRATLNRAIEFERIFKKPFYQFSELEILGMYKSIHAISIISLQNMNLLLKHASRWFIYYKRLNSKSAYEGIDKELLQECVDIEKQKSLIFSRKDLTKIQDELLNYTDKGILEMLFLGAGSNWLKELTFFDMSQVNHKEMLICFKTGKEIKINKDVYDLIKKACEEDELISFGETLRVSRVKTHGLFKQRCNALSANDNIDDDKDQERRFRFIQRRLMLISNDLGVHLTSGNIQMSGLLHYLKRGVEKTGLNFREYVKTEEAKELANRYDIFSEFYSQILLEKFENYFI